MRREHFVVAELYRHLARFVDADHPIYLSLDGEAAKRGVREGLFVDPDVPDLLFTLIDGREIGIEVKVAYGRRFSAGHDQFTAWFHPGTGAHRPAGWVVADEDLRSFFYWPHAKILQQRTSPPKPSETNYVQIPMPTATSIFASIRHVALHILRSAPQGKAR